MTTPPLSPAPAAWRRDRIGRLTALAPEDASAGLLWLAMTFPAVCDAMLDKLESDDIDEPSSHHPEQFCVECDSDIGIFLRSDWSGAATAVAPPLTRSAAAGCRQ